jgi:hypothetical protein
MNKLSFTQSSNVKFDCISFTKPLETKNNYCQKHDHNFIDSKLKFPDFYDRNTRKTIIGKEHWIGCDKCREQQREKNAYSVLAEDMKAKGMMLAYAPEHPLEKKWIPDPMSLKWKNPPQNYDKPSDKYAKRRG